MSERGTAPVGEDGTEGLGDQPTLAATPDQQAASSGARARTPGGDQLLGREVAGRYAILERLGEGGMGVVYVAEHLHLKRRVAFKVIHPELAAHEELLLRFKREALATGQLDHPHIAAAIDFGELDGGGAFMVMPLVRGASLQSELDAQGALDPRRAARIGAQIADALGAAHAVGIVHRDLKPDNVLLERRSDGSESAKVLDFGVASLAGRSEGLNVDARPLTQAGTILGTPGYMSPEQASAGEVDHRTDLYALGVIMWELCRGERLFDGDDITQIFAKQFTALPPALELGRQQSSRALSALVSRLLAWDKNERPATANEVRDALRRIAEQPEPRLPAVVLPEVGRYLAQHRQYRFHAGAVLAVVLALLALVLRDREPTPTLTSEPSPSAPESADKPASARVTKRTDRAVRASESPPHKSTDRKRADDDQDEDLDALEEALFRGATREARRDAAKRVLRSGEKTPRYLQLVADLELADRCATKKNLLAEMRAVFDPRVVPALERLAQQPRRGCGLLRLSDCLACLRRDLDQTIGALGHVEAP